jgi:hypothetical protein
MKWLKRIIFGLVALVTFVALVIAFENWRGKRAWLKFKTEWESKGESFDVASVIPDKVPDDQNFAMTPFLQPLFDYQYAPWAIYKNSNGLNRAQSISLSGTNPPPEFARREKNKHTDLKEWQNFFSQNTNYPPSTARQSASADILHALSKFDDVVAELRAASARPRSVYPVHYHESYTAHIPHLKVLKSISDVVRLRALAELEQGSSAEAFADLRLCIYVGESLKSEPLLISQMVRLAILERGCGTIWETLDRWNDEQLVELQRTLSEIDVLEDYPRGMRGERVFANDVFGRIRRGEYFPGELAFAARYGPGGFLYQNQLTVNALHQKYTFAPVDLERRRVDAALTSKMDDIPELKGWHPYRVFAHLLFPTLSKAVVRVTKTQTDLDLAAIACALERYRRSNGSYPERLEELMPRFMTKVPHDLVSGESLRYRRTATDDFLLYAVAFNEKDDNGTPATLSNARMDGDWVWRPAPKRDSSANR